MTRLDETQRLLLLAVIGRDAHAVRAWREWRDLTDLEELDRDSQWLLPALDQNLRRLGVPGDSLARYHNVYRHNWYKNHLALHRAAGAIRDLRGRGPVVISGGAAMAMAHYETIGERPFQGVDILQGAEVPEWHRVPLEWRSLRASAPEPVDQLVEICTRREEWDELSGLLWLVDAAALLRRPAVRWSRVEARAEALGGADAIGPARQALDQALFEGAIG